MAMDDVLLEERTINSKDPSWRTNECVVVVKDLQRPIPKIEWRLWGLAIHNSNQLKAQRERSEQQHFREKRLCN